MSLPPDGELNQTPPRPFWMIALFGIAAIVGLFNIGAFLYGLTLPDEWSVNESIVIGAPPEVVAPYIMTPRRWSEWSSWSVARDPTAEFAFQGPESGEGASFTWRGEQLGFGTLTITDTSPTAIRYRLEFQKETFSENGQIRLEPAEDGTRVTWTDGGEVSGTIGRFFRQRLQDSVAADFAGSLRRLKNVVEDSL